VKELFIGIDWGSKSHAVCVVDAQDRKLLEREVPHRGQDVLAFLDQVLELAGGDPTGLVAAMETPHGVMVEALLERGVTTYALNPKQLDRFRDRHSGAGAKDDDLDAYVLATSLRTDRRLFREISIPSAELMALTALSRTYQTLTDQVLALANQVREQLLRYYPQMRDLGDWHEEEWLWHLFEAAPTPARAALLTERRVAGLLQGHRIRRYKAKDVLNRLRERPLPVAAGVPEAAAKRIALLLPVLRAANSQRNACSHEMKQLLTSFTKADSPEKKHHDAALLLSLPGIGVHNGAVMLTEAYSALQQRDYQALRRLAGVAPVSKRTGGRAKAPHVQQRHACSRRLREAFYHWGRIAARYDPRARQHYADLRARGHSRGRAIRGVTDRLIAVLVAMLRSGQTYDPARRALPTEIQSAAA
jgi:transposase